jgi:hypothetical protein
VQLISKSSLHWFENFADVNRELESFQIPVSEWNTELFRMVRGLAILASNLEGVDTTEEAQLDVVRIDLDFSR